MGFSQTIDWSTALSNGEWDNIGRSLIEENCKHKTQDKDNKNRETNIRYSGYCDKCGISEDSAIPMMNYCYPLDIKPDDEKVLKVVNKTNCTVMYHEPEDAYYIVLTGGGMDLSQDIAYAYLLLQKWIPEDLISSVSKQKGLSISEKKFEILKKAIIEQTKNYKDRFENLNKEWRAIK